MKQNNFLKELFHFKQTDDSIIRVIGAGLNIAIPMSIGLISGNMKFGTLGALGTFAFLSFTPLPLPKLAKRILKAGLGIMGGFYLGLLSTLVPWTIPNTKSWSIFCHHGYFNGNWNEIAVFGNVTGSRICWNRCFNVHPHGLLNGIYKRSLFSSPSE